MCPEPCKCVESCSNAVGAQIFHSHEGGPYRRSEMGSVRAQSSLPGSAGVGRAPSGVGEQRHARDAPAERRRRRERGVHVQVRELADPEVLLQLRVDSVEPGEASLYLENLKDT